MKQLERDLIEPHKLEGMENVPRPGTDAALTSIPLNYFLSAPCIQTAVAAHWHMETAAQ